MYPVQWYFDTPTKSNNMYITCTCTCSSCNLDRCLSEQGFNIKALNIPTDLSYMYIMYVGGWATDTRTGGHGGAASPRIIVPGVQVLVKEQQEVLHVVKMPVKTAPGVPISEYSTLWSTYVYMHVYGPFLHVPALTIVLIAGQWGC